MDKQKNNWYLEETATSEIINTVDKMIEKSKLEAINYLRNINELKEKLAQQKKEIVTKPFNLDMFFSADQLLCNAIREGRKHIIRVNKLSMASPFLLLEDVRRMQNDASERSIFSEDDTICLLEDEAIYIKIPLLWSRQINAYMPKERRQDFEKSNQLFAESIHYSIEKSQNFLSYDFKKFDRKVFVFLFVYSIKHAKQFKIPDNDNHDTKNVQDAIAMFLPGGDSAFSTSTLLTAEATNEIPEGTYVTVFPSIPSENFVKSIIEKWTFYFYNDEPFWC